jgi:hypothetical protein
MSRIFSFRDLLRIKDFKGLNEIQLLSLENDAKVNSYLAQFGFDITKAILYVPSKHRDSTGKVAVGFQAVGEIDPYNRAYLTSRMSTTIERLIAASKTDMSLTKELAKLMGSSVDLGDNGAVEEAADFPDDLVEPDHLAVIEEIRTLEKIRDHVRGSPYNESGALKTPEEYKVLEVA